MQSTEKRIGTKIWLSILSVGLVVAIALNVVALVGQDDTEENTIPAIRQEVESINNALPELEKVGTELKSYITVLETTSEQLQSDLTDIDTAINTLETEVYSKTDSEKTEILNQLNSEKAALESKLAETNKELEAAKTSNTASEKAITDQITALETELEQKTAKIGELKAELDGEISDSERKVLDELNTVKADIAAQLESIDGAVTTLRAKDAELEQKLTAFKDYVDGEFAATEDWATTTFTTLEQFNDIQASITEINSLIDTTQQSITALETNLNDKIASDIATAVAEVDADIAAKVTEITDAYTAAVNTACGQTEFTLREAIREAIDASETSMKQWVYEQMQTGFADLEAKIAELEGKTAELEEKTAELEYNLGVSDEDALRAAVKRGGAFKLSADISLERSVNIYNEITINGGAYKITGSNLYCVQGLVLTINSGYIEEIYAPITASRAKIFVEGGTIDKIRSVDDWLEITMNGGNVNSLNFQNGKLIVNGGVIKNLTTANRLIDGAICEVTINGGTFYFNPTAYVDTTTHNVTTTTDGGGTTVWVVTAK